MLSDDACLTLSDDSASHALGYYRGVLRNSSLEPKAPALCPGLSLFSVNRRAPNRQQAPALVKWSWRPFWGCRRYDKSRPVASLRRVGAHIADCRIFEKVPPRFPERKAPIYVLARRLINRDRLKAFGSARSLLAFIASLACLARASFPREAANLRSAAGVGLRAARVAAAGSCRRVS